MSAFKGASQCSKVDGAHCFWTHKDNTLGAPVSIGIATTLKCRMLSACKRVNERLPYASQWRQH